MLRDRLVRSINNDAIQHRLLSEQNLTFDKALTTVQGLEAAAKNLRKLHHDKKPSGGNGEVHKVARDCGPRKEKCEGQTVQEGVNTVLQMRQARSLAYKVPTPWCQVSQLWKGGASSVSLQK